MERMQGQAEVLCVQDGTDLNFADHGGCKDLGADQSLSEFGRHAGDSQAFAAGA